jgi:hypothetical protein
VPLRAKIYGRALASVQSDPQIAIGDVFASRTGEGLGMTYLEIFFLLQVLDVFTTLIGIRMGGAEMSPVIAWLMRLSSPVAALSMVKLLGFCLAGYCLWSRRLRVLHATNYFFALIVVWNVYNILRAVGLPL